MPAAPAWPPHDRRRLATHTPAVPGRRRRPATRRGPPLPRQPRGFLPRSMPATQEEPACAAAIAGAATSADAADELEGRTCVALGEPGAGRDQGSDGESVRLDVSAGGVRPASAGHAPAPARFAPDARMQVRRWPRGRQDPRAPLVVLGTPQHGGEFRSAAEAPPQRFQEGSRPSTARFLAGASGADAAALAQRIAARSLGPPRTSPFRWPAGPRARTPDAGPAAVRHRPRHVPPAAGGNRLIEIAGLPGRCPSGSARRPAARISHPQREARRGCLPPCRASISPVGLAG